MSGGRQFGNPGKNNTQVKLMIWKHYLPYFKQSVRK